MSGGCYNSRVRLLPIIVPLAVVLFLAALFLILRRGQKKRIEALRVACDSLGFAFEEKGDPEAVKSRADLPLFGHGHTRRVTNVMTGRVGGQEVKLFDYQYTTGGGKESHTSRQTVAFFPGGGQHLPDFVLAPENVLHKIGQAFGYQDIDFDSNPAFSSRYLLRGRDDYAIRSAFSPDTLSFFEQHEGWHVEVQGGTVGVYRGGKRCAPENVAMFLEDTRAVLRALTGR